MIVKVLLALWMAVIIVAAFLYTEAASGFPGQTSRILFFHVPQAWVATLSFLVSMIASAVYLAKRRVTADDLALSAAELGFLFCVLATVTGSIFAKVTWGSFWNWDPRETSLFILILIYGAYFALRSAVEIGERKASLSAVYSILAFLTVPFLVFVVPRVYQSLHPTESVIDGELRFQLPLPYLLIFLCSILGFTMIFIWMHKMEIFLYTIDKQIKKE